MKTQIYNGKILIPGGRWINGGSVVIIDDKIDEIYGHSRILRMSTKVSMPVAGISFPEVSTYMCTAEAAVILWKRQRKPSRQLLWFIADMVPRLCSPLFHLPQKKQSAQPPRFAPE